jgi:glycosyltransferase involved in cell wall biosynthesis
MPTRRLKILQIFNRYLHYGGEEGSVTRIGDALQELHDVSYFLYSTSQLAGEGLWSKLKLPCKAYYNSDVEEGLERLESIQPQDVWQIHNIFPVMSPVVYELAFKWKKPIVHFLHNYRLSCVNGFFLNHGVPCQRCLSGNFWPAFQTACWHESHLQSGWMGLITNRIRRMDLFGKVSQWVAISEAQKREHVRMGIPAEKIKVVYHFLETDEAPLPPARKPTAVFVGRLSVEKGVMKLLDAWEKIQGGERRLLVVGDGPEYEKLKARARKLRGVTFTGFLKGKDQLQCWQEALFSVVPSIWIEPFGMTVLESWAKGRPVVAHAIGALSELVEDGVDGRLADPTSIEDLAAKMDALLSNPDQAEQMGLAGRQKLASTFSRSQWLNKITEVYNNLPEFNG